MFDFLSMFFVFIVFPFAYSVDVLFQNLISDPLCENSSFWKNVRNDLKKTENEIERLKVAEQTLRPYLEKYQNILYFTEPCLLGYFSILIKFTKLLALAKPQSFPMFLDSYNQVNGSKKLIF
jgi:hypothetical protein